MRRGVAALECVSKNDLAWLILRVTQQVSPCSKTSLIAYISGDYATSPTSEIIFDALSRLEALALIQIAAEQIAITDKGRRFVNELAVDPLSPRTPLTARNSPAQHAPHPKRFWQDYVAGNRAFMRRMLSSRPTGIALQLRRRALLIGSGARPCCGTPRKPGDRHLGPWPLDAVDWSFLAALSWWSQPRLPEPSLSFRRNVSKTHGEKRLY